MRTAVVLPAPLGPRRASTVPVRAARSAPASAGVPPNRFTRPSAWTAWRMSAPLVGVAVRGACCPPPLSRRSRRADTRPARWHRAGVPLAPAARAAAGQVTGTVGAERPNPLECRPGRLPLFEPSRSSRAGPPSRKDPPMRAFTLDSFDAAPGLREDLAAPAVGDGDLLIRVRASSVNPVDTLIAA